MPGPPQAYYDLSHARVAGHQEPLDRMQKHGILIDGEGVVDGGETKILLQIFSKTTIGLIFFEFILRKGDDGFGEGNFEALFESIEHEHIENGEIAAEQCLTFGNFQHHVTPTFDIAQLTIADGGNEPAI